MNEDTNTSIHAIEAWIKPSVASTAGSWVTGTGTTYVNGVAGTNLRVDEWNHVIKTLTTASNTTHTINGTGRVGMVNIYHTPLTTTQINQLYLAYFGADALVVEVPTSVTVTSGPQPYELYAYEWSIIGAG